MWPSGNRDGHDEKKVSGEAKIQAKTQDDEFTHLVSS